MNRIITITLCLCVLVLASGCGDVFDPPTAPEHTTPPLEPADEPTASTAADCPPLDENCGPVDPGGGGSTSLRLNVANGWNLADCQDTSMGGGDSDGDGLNDGCEYDVAYAFAPVMMVDPDDDVVRDEYYVVMPGEGSKIMIFYAFGYHRDIALVTGHNGDSEFLVFELFPATERNKPWSLLRAYLSAHRGRSTDSSAKVYGSEMETGWQGHPVVWVANGKHANYVSQIACDSGAFISDSCDDNTFETWFYVRDYGNLGQSNNPAYSRCGVPSRSISTSNTECYWNRRRFYGWQGSGGGSGGAYQGFLSDFGFTGQRAHLNG